MAIPVCLSAELVNIAIENFNNITFQFTFSSVSLRAVSVPVPLISSSSLPLLPPSDTVTHNCYILSKSKSSYTRKSF